MFKVASETYRSEAGREDSGGGSGGNACVCVCVCVCGGGGVT